MNNDHKIGILTLHSGYNEGAILQAFCLASNLRSNLANKVEIVDHRYPSKIRAYGPIRDEKTRILDDFVNHSLPLSSKRFISDDHQTTFKYVRENYSAIVTGSDELWKLNYTKRFFGLVSEQNNPWCPAFPNVYWPDESIKIPKIAYAVSIGQTDWRTIPRNHLTRIKNILSHYVLLGIRDQRTMSFLKWLDSTIGSKAEWVPDPTFSTDFLSFVDKEMLKQKLQQWGVDFGRPRICIVLEDVPGLNEAIREMKDRGFQIVGLSIPNRTADVVLFDKGFTPLEWAGVFGLMDFCISQRMHACISCILQDTPFVAVDFYGNPMDDETKIRDLMRSFNLLDYYYNGKRDLRESFLGILEKLISKPWPDRDIAQKRLLFHNRSNEFTAKIREILEDTVTGGHYAS